jgi:molybdate transport system substrate-binding protein
MTTQAKARSPLKLLSSNSMRATLSQLIPHFERDSGYSISIAYDLADVTKRRVLDGATGDVVIVNSKAIGELVEKGRIASDGHTNLAQSGVGVAVLAGARKPDISSVASFRSALLNARTVAYTSAGESGVYFSRLIERLGITEQIQAKSRTRPSGIIGKLVVNREAEIAIQFSPQLREVQGLDYLGLLPQELQVVSVMAAGILTTAEQPQTARALLSFLTSTTARELFKTMGYDMCAPQT